MEHSIAAAQAPACAHAFLATELRRGAPARRCRSSARRRPRSRPLGRPGRVDQGPVRRRRPADAGRLDRAGRRARRPRPMPRPSPACARAGAALLGRTNMTEFAFSGVGINPHHGTPANPATLRSTRRRAFPAARPRAARSRWPAGAAWAALGSDTGGSIRIPAALQGIVGFKSTARLVPTDGAVPLSTTLDTVCAMTRSVRDAIAAARDPRRPPRRRRRRAARRAPLRACRARCCSTARAGRRRAPSSAALRALRAAGARIERDRRCRCSAELAAINATGGFSAAESWAWHRQLLADARRRLRPARRACASARARP